MDRDGIKPSLGRVGGPFPRLSHLWLDAGYNNGKGKGEDRIVAKALGSTAQIVRHPPKPRYVWLKEGEEPDREKLEELLPEPGFKVLPRRRWVVERTFSWIDKNRGMSKEDYDERLPESGEAFIYAAQ